MYLKLREDVSGRSGGGQDLGLSRLIERWKSSTRFSTDEAWDIVAAGLEDLRIGTPQRDLVRNLALERCSICAALRILDWRGPIGLICVVNPSL